MFGGDVSLRAICTATGTEAHLQTFVGTDLGVSGTDVAANLCTYLTNLDTIRALHTSSFHPKAII